MVVKGMNFKSLPFAGFAAGYVMYFVDKWLNGFLGLFGVFPGTENAWWMLEHHIDGIILALLFAWPAVYGKLPGSGTVKGLVFGILWWIILTIISLVAGALGAVIFRQMGFSVLGVINNLILHIVYGVILGALYVTPEETRTTV